jgi:proteasome lid subunit RPN8/RPN11
MSRADRKSRRKHRGGQEAADHQAVQTLAAESRPEESTGANVETPVVTAQSPNTEIATLTNAPEIITRDLSKEATGDEWPHRAWPQSLGPRGSGFQVIIKRSVLNAINRHGLTTSDVEVCGVLAGNVYRDEAGPYLRVDAAVRGEFSGNSSAQVTFTAETWNHIQGVMEKDHPELRVVGWYHTHPGFGIFLSDMDLFIHGNFFNLPWQIALVYDPISGEDGVFVWREGKTERVAFIVEEDVEKEIVTIPVSAELTAAALADFSRRMQGMEKRQKRVLVALSFLVLIAMAWPFVLYTIMSDRPRETHVPVAKMNADADPSTRPLIPATNQASNQAAAPTTLPVVAATLPAVPTTAPIVVVLHPIAPTTMEVDTTQPTKPDDKNDVRPSVIRPNTPTIKGPRVLEGPSETPTQNR